MASLQNRGAAPLGYKLAAHLLRRATYNITKTRIEHFATLNVDQALTELLDYTSFSKAHLNLPEAVAYDTGLPYINSHVGSSGLNNGTLRSINIHWYMDEAKKATTLQFKLATFLHQNFIADSLTNRHGDYYDYMLRLMYYSKESYKDLAYKITFGNRMLLYLSNHYNTKNAPNEDYAREFLELFTITKGEQIAVGNYTTYTELDVQQAARVLTGFRLDTSRLLVDAATGIPHGKTKFSVHDIGDKTFSHAFGNHTILGAVDANDMFRELQDFVNMVFDQNATALTICRKLYRYFVRRNIDIETENDIIIPLAAILKNNNYNIEITIRTLLSSSHFYDEDDSNSDDEIIGALVKPPLDLVLQSLNLLEVTLPSPDDSDEPVRKKHYLFYYFARHQLLKYTDMYLFRPLSVAGYKAMYQEPDYDKHWISFNTLDVRSLLGKSIIEGKRRFANTSATWYFNYDVVSFVKNSGNFSNPRIADTLMTELYDLLFVEAPSTLRHDYFLNDLFLKTLSPINWRFEWDNYINTGNDVSVKGHLTSLFSGLIDSPEYQIF